MCRILVGQNYAFEYFKSTLLYEKWWNYDENKLDPWRQSLATYDKLGYFIWLSSISLYIYALPLYKRFSESAWKKSLFKSNNMKERTTAPLTTKN